ncbi:MAG TPA: phosphotransferase enzyme family protein, partial [Bacteroidetes bacterium]|nr:phosphotransferase enzyme family protein [Bacteroidota bacterium]
MQNQPKTAALEHLQALFRTWAGAPASTIETIPQAGSDRQYWRLSNSNQCAIGAYNPDSRENDAFISFSKHFLAQNLPVPEIYAEDRDHHIYLQRDLGNTPLLSRLIALRENSEFPPVAIALYQKALTQLAHLQIEGGKALDYSKCYPRAAFDQQSMHWDLNYFKYYFLKLAHIPFDEQGLENDFQTLINYLLSTDTDHFMFRDFQARNIMLIDDEPWFIDYQGGRKGALQYDVASLLYQAKANLPHAIREQLLDHYLDTVSKLIPLDRAHFRTHYYAYVLIRTLQVLGAYGFRGFYERRPHFLESIPFALQNLQWLLENANLPIKLPELWPVLHSLSQAESLTTLSHKWDQPNKLTIRVQSFSYKKALPSDPSGNGGGFLFDCRALHNPGRYQPYKKLTGRDQPVIDFLLANS